GAVTATARYTGATCTGSAVWSGTGWFDSTTGALSVTITNPNSDSCPASIDYDGNLIGTSAVGTWFSGAGAGSQTGTFSLNFEGQLKLFMNADGEFDPTDPLTWNEISSYVPGSRLSDGISLPVPTSGPIQSVQIVAASVDRSNVIVSPPVSGSVSFSLTNT